MLSELKIPHAKKRKESPLRRKSNKKPFANQQDANSTEHNEGLINLGLAAFSVATLNSLANPILYIWRIQAIRTSLQRQLPFLKTPVSFHTGGGGGGGGNSTGTVVQLRGSLNTGEKPGRRKKFCLRKNKKKKQQQSSL